MESRPKVEKIEIRGAISATIKDNGDVVSDQPATFTYRDGSLFIEYEYDHDQSESADNYPGSIVGVHHGDIVHYHGDRVTYQTNNVITMTYHGEDYRMKLLDTPMGKVNYFVPSNVVLKWHGSELLNINDSFVIGNMKYYEMVTRSGRKIYVPLGFKLESETAPDESERVFKANVALKEVKLHDSSTLTIRDPDDVCRFSVAKNLGVICSGSSKFDYLCQSDFDTLRVNLSGSSNFCARRVSTNVFVANISGASSVKLGLVKELATGSASGVSKIRFAQSAHLRRQISTSGLSKVVIN